MKPGKPLEDLSAPNRWKLILLTTISIVLLVLSVTPVFIDPLLTAARYAFRLGKGSLVYDIMTREMPGAFVEAYIFNITNTEKFMTGEDHKLKVEEIGPFTYQEFRHNDNFFLDEESQIVSYTPRIKPRFYREYSVADPMDLNVSVPNIPMLAMGSTMGTYPFWAQMGFNLLTSRLDVKPVINLRAHDFMWGYKEPLIALGNTLIPGWINFEKLGVMDRLYDQTVKDNLVLGASDAEKFLIKSVNGEGGMGHRGYDPNVQNPSRWYYQHYRQLDVNTLVHPVTMNAGNGDRCNSFVDTYEGLAYPPGLTPETKLRLYRNVFCSILDLQYVGSTDMEFASKAFVYRLSNGTFRKSSENKCVCGKVCVDGMTDLSPCFYGFGVSFSQAHFLDVDPTLYERIEGIKPDFDKYGSEFIVDPNLGSVMTTKMTVQLNVVMEDASFNTRTKPFSNMIVPVLYFKIIQPELPEETKQAFRDMYQVYPYVVIAIQVTFFLIAVSLLTYAVRFVRFARLCKKAIVQVNKNEKPGPVYEVPLIEKGQNFAVTLISNEQQCNKHGALISEVSSANNCSE